MCATLTATRGPSHNSVRVPHPRCIHLLLVSNSTYRKVANESVHSQRKIHSWIQHHKLSGFTWDIAAMWKPWIYTQYRKTGVQKDKSTIVCANVGCLKRHLLSQMIGMFHSKGGHLYLKSPNSSTSRMFRLTHRRWNSWRITNILVHQLKTSHKKGLAKYQVICTEYKCLRREYQTHLKVLKCAATV